MRKSFLILLLVGWMVPPALAQLIVGKLINQYSTGVPGLQVSLYLGGKVLTCNTQTDGTFTLNNSISSADLSVLGDRVISEVFPNPFSKKTSVNILLRVRSNVRIDIYNMFGQRLKQAVNQTFNAGLNRIDLDPGTLTGGKYLATFLINGRFAGSRKLWLIPGYLPPVASENTGMLKSSGMDEELSGTKIDSIVATGASMGKKVFLNLPVLTDRDLNLGNFMVIETSNILEGVQYYTGSTLRKGLVTYHEGTELVSDSAYLGRVIVLADKSLSESTITNLIKSQKGNVTQKIPKAGYYLAEVESGKEGVFIDSLNHKTGVKRAIPNTIARYMSQNVTVIDNCRQSHGNQVQCVLTNTVPWSAVTCLNDDNGAGIPLTEKTIELIFASLKEANGSTSIINISSFGGFNNGVDYQNLPQESKDILIQGTKNYLAAVLTPISQLDESWTKNLVITFCAGNDNAPLNSILNDLRQDILIDKLLRNNILIVGNNDNVFHDSNDAPGDPDFANMTDASSCDLKTGTSFAAPRAAAVIWNLTNNLGITGNQALKAAKIAVAANPQNVLIEAEAQKIAAAIKSGNKKVGIYAGGPFTFSNKVYHSECTYNKSTSFKVVILLSGTASDVSSIKTLVDFKLSFNEGDDCFLETECRSSNSVIKSKLNSSDTNNSLNSDTGKGNFLFCNGTLTREGSSNFTGTLNENGTITGTVTIVPPAIWFDDKGVIPVTLTKQ
jgi:hypothetical protein